MAVNPNEIAVLAEVKDPFPVLGPILALLKSRKFITLVIGAITSIIVTLIPALVTMREEIITLLTFGAAAVILGISHEDAASMARAAPGEVEEQIRQLQELASRFETIIQE